MTNQTNKIITRIKKSIPPAGGVIPTTQTNTIKKAFEKANSSPTSSGLEVLNSIKATISAANCVGLELTTNETSRVVREKLREIKTGFPFPSMYKGVSFNPQTYTLNRGKGEWIVLLDFFSLIRSLLQASTKQKASPPRFSILDAGLYWIVNLLGDQGIKLTASTPEKAAQQLLTVLLNSLASQQFDLVIECNRVRNAYLQAIAQQFPANSTPPVFTLKDIWNDPEFLPFLAKALDFFCKKDKKNQWKVINPVNYERYMPYSPWVTPLVTAEQIFVGQKLGVYGILSPTAEAGWNKAIDQFSRFTKTPTFIAWMYTRKLGKTLSYQTVPYFSDNANIIEQKLNQAQMLDPTANQLIINLISPFISKSKAQTVQKNLQKNNLKAVAKFIADFLTPIEKQAKEILISEPIITPTPLNQIGWLSQFPPGIC